MAEEVMPVDELVFPGLDGGHVVADNVVVVDDVAGFIPASQVLAQQRTSLRWTEPMSAFMLRQMCQLISTGVRTDKGFKEVHLNKVAKALQEFYGNEVSGTQVYNHLRKWRQRWVKLSKLRDLSGAQWDEDSCMIVLEEEHYNGHTKVCNLTTLYSSLHDCSSLFFNCD
jgi:hypothetical protein